MTNPLPANRFKRRVLSHVEKADKAMLAQTDDPDVWKLYHICRPYKGNGTQHTFEMIKGHIARTASLSAEYDKWIKVVIDFLNI
jgi:hypothetical protein